MHHKTSSKKLQFGTEKCRKMHVGKLKAEYKCKKLLIDKWTEQVRFNIDKNEFELIDSFEGEECMEEKEEEKYLGVLLSHDGRNMKNVKAKVARGTGIVKRIITILDTIPLGKHYFEVGMLLRDSLLLSSILYNAEAWYNLTNAELNLIETVDLMFLRKLMKAPKTTPKEMFFLELGCVPIRQIITEKRISFLHYILNQDSKSYIYNFFQSQLVSRTKRDWITTVMNYLEKLEIHFSFEEIRKMKKDHFMKLIKDRIKSKTFQEMEKVKGSHSKVKNLKHEDLLMQKYLKPNRCNMNIKDGQLIFKLRCKTTNAKMNLKGMYDNLECTACGQEEETQEHIINCSKLNENKLEKNVNYEKIFDGTVHEKLKVAKRFRENFDLLENMKK